MDYEILTVISFISLMMVTLIWSFIEDKSSSPRSVRPKCKIAKNKITKVEKVAKGRKWKKIKWNR